MAAVSHLGFVGYILGPTRNTWGYFISVQNLVGIAVVLIILKFEYFVHWLENSYLCSQNRFFGIRLPKWEQYLKYPETISLCGNIM